MENSDKAKDGPAAGVPSNQPWVDRVYIVDDHRFFTFALTSLVNCEADMTVCGAAHDEATAMADIVRLNPDIIVMDVKLNSQNGFAMATAVRAFSRHTPILFVSSLQNPSFEVDSKWLEPCSFVEKTKAPADIIRGIRETLAKFRLLQRLHPTSNPGPKS